jgi:hypothetical protein
MSRQAPPREYPNVRARLRLSRMNPILPPRQSFTEIWMKGTRFRVCDEAGRHVAEILGDLSPGRGLGVPAHSLEEIMDIWSQSQDGGAPARGVTELYGDRATGQGWVRRGGQAAWPMRAEELAPAAEQILAGGVDERLQPRGPVTRLGRPAIEYRGILDGEDQAGPYACEVTRIVSPPYLLLNAVRDARNANHASIREVVSLEEGASDDRDLTPP